MLAGCTTGRAGHVRPGQAGDHLSRAFLDHWPEQLDLPAASRSATPSPSLACSTLSQDIHIMMIEFIEHEHLASSFNVYMSVAEHVVWPHSCCSSCTVMIKLQHPCFDSIQCSMLGASKSLGPAKASSWSELVVCNVSSAARATFWDTIAERAFGLLFGGIKNGHVANIMCWCRHLQACVHRHHDR